MEEAKGIPVGEPAFLGGEEPLVLPSLEAVRVAPQAVVATEGELRIDVEPNPAVRRKADEETPTRRVSPVVAGSRAEYRVGQLALLDTTGGTAVHQQRLRMVGLEALRHLAAEHDGIAVRAERGRREPELHPTLPSELDVLGAGDLVLVPRNAKIVLDPFDADPRIDQLSILRKRTSRQRIGKVRRPPLVDADAGGPARRPAVAQAARTADVDRAPT